MTVPVLSRLWEAPVQLLISASKDREEKGPRGRSYPTLRYTPPLWEKWASVKPVTLTYFKPPPKNKPSERPRQGNATSKVARMPMITLFTVKQISDLTINNLLRMRQVVFMEITYTKPLKPIKAIARMDAVSRAMGTPLNSLGTLLRARASRSPAKSTIARAKPAEVARAYTML